MVPEEWAACLDAWITLAQAHLRQSASDFHSKSCKDESLLNFLSSYVEYQNHNTPGSLEKNLRREVYLLVHRLLSDPGPPSSLLEWSFLSNFSRMYAKTASLKPLLISLWTSKEARLGEGNFRMTKLSLTESLETTPPQVSVETLNRHGALFHASPDIAKYYMVGSDLLDALDIAYASPKIQKAVVTVTYLGLIALLEGNKPNHSLLLDHLYSLESSSRSSKRSAGATSLLSDLIANTPLLQRLRDGVMGNDTGRAKPLLYSLEQLRRPDGAKGKTLIRRKIDKGNGKGQAADEYGHGAFGGTHVHRISLITQIQDLFPNLGSGFVFKLLDEYEDDAEQVTAHLLEQSLPPHLLQADQTEQLVNDGQTGADMVPGLAPRSTTPLLPTRRNIFDNDEFDQLAIDSSRLHIGRKNESSTADTILSDRSSAPNKAAILSALAAFDSDDDERDDTYDAEDVGGTVDSARPGSDDVDADLRDNNEEPLFSAYKISPEVFERDSATRRGKARAALKSETGMTDETIEGWAIMIGRDPRRLRRLEAKFATFTGAQKELAPTSYRESPAGSGTEDSGGGGGRGGRGGFPSRRGRGRGGRGGSMAGPANEKGTQLSRDRKEAHKGSRANHNRRDQRAKKMARGGFPG
ncbi:MAG: hypothetical protein M1827_000006 [Pycnora praestabilis]|nr:MAG: hypothetical protein M1827_000006 [Pycnora praestabilis]